MGKKNYSVLIIDDHPLISDAYENAFREVEINFDHLKFSIDLAQDCDEAYKLIMHFSKYNKILDIVFLDIRLPASKDGQFLSGEDLGLKIIELLPDTKIIISTTLNDNYRVHSIFKNLNPDGFLIKNDITSKDLVETIVTVVNDPPHYSKSVIKLLRKEVSNDFLIDNIDRRLLYELSIGTMMKDLPVILPLSIAGIEKRKRHLKEIFNTKSANDKELLSVAKEKGFI